MMNKKGVNWDAKKRIKFYDYFLFIGSFRVFAHIQEYIPKVHHH